MKRLLIAFGVLDILTIIRSLTIKMNLAGVWTDTQIQLLTIGKWTLYVSLVLSSYFLIRQNKIGLWISYGQFPLRIIFMILSFGFILSITDFFGGLGGQVDHMIMWGILGLEIFRLIVTITIHRKYYHG